MLDAVRKFIPSLAPFASFCCSQHSKLFLNATHIQSESGVKQGDPLGPLLFSLGLWPIIKELDDKLPNLMQNSWYLDDEIIASTEEELCESLEVLATHGNKCGLELRRDKCELWSTSRFIAVDSRIKRNSQSGIEILGAAIGTPTFVASCLEKRVKKLDKVLDNLGYIEDTQCALGILRRCLSAPKLVYSLRRNTPSTESKTILEKFDHLQRTTFENILGSVISDNSWEQACLPISKTGAGVRRSLKQLKAAYVGSLCQSANIVEQITGVNPTHEVSFTDLVEEFSALGIPHLTQEKIQEQFDNTALSDLLEGQTSTREKTRLLSVSLSQSGARLTAAPIPALGLHLQPNEFRGALKYRLGVPLYDSDRTCPYYKSAILDIFGDHAVSCHGRGDIISRMTEYVTQ